MSLIIRYLKKYKLLFLIDCLSVFGFALVELGIPTLISRMVDKGIATNQTSFLMKNWLIMIFISIVGVCGTILLGYTCAKISNNITRDIRNDVYEHAQKFSSIEMEYFGISSMITRTNNDAYQIMLFINVLLRVALISPVMMIISVILIINISMPLSFVVLATIPIILLGVYIVAKVSEPISEHQQKSIDTMNQVLKENISGIRVIRAFNQQVHEKDRFSGINRYYKNESSKLFKLMSCTEPTFFLLMNIATISVYIISCRLLSLSIITMGDLLAFVEYLFHVMMSVLLFCMVFMMYPRANVSAKRILEVLETEPKVKNKLNCISCPPITKIDFKHVSFSYPDSEESVLKDISFSVENGQKIAVIGSTGSGKSTIIKLLARFYDVSDGSIQINGKDIREYELNSLRSRMGYVAQKAKLFKASIKDNIAFGRPNASMEDIIESATIAQADDFIQQRECGYEDEITEEGTNVSGGQKQRLSIARAILLHPSLYLYDDSFSALDFKTDAKLRKALKPEINNAIFFVIAQRVSTIMDADQILVFDEGKLVGQGTHKQLMKNCSIYREIAYSQLSVEELMDHE